MNLRGRLRKLEEQTPGAAPACRLEVDLTGGAPAASGVYPDGRRVAWNDVPPQERRTWQRQPHAIEVHLI